MSEVKVGKRFNKGKLRWRNIPLFLVRPLVKVGQFGEEKYGTYNFLDGLPTNDTIDSLHRHLDSFIDPYQSDYDEESGQHHLAHVAWNALVALYHITTRPELDDRRKENPEKNTSLSKTIKELNEQFGTSKHISKEDRELLKEATPKHQLDPKTCGYCTKPCGHAHCVTNDD